MGRRGPAKRPTALQRLRGFPGKRGKRREPVPEAPSHVTAPSWLDPVAKGEWRRLEPELSRLGLLTVLDLSKFSAYCRWYSRWRAYEAQLATLPSELLKAKRSSYVQGHPLVSMARQAADLMNRFGAQFGLSPSDRASISLPLDPTAPKHDTPQTPPRPPRDDFEEFLRKSRRAK